MIVFALATLGLLVCTFLLGACTAALYFLNILQSVHENTRRILNHWDKKDVEKAREYFPAGQLGVIVEAL